MKRAEMTEKLHERTGADPAFLTSMSDDRLQDYFRRSVSPGLARLQYETGLGMIAAGSFIYCAMGSSFLGTTMLFGALLIAQSLDNKRGRNEEIRNTIATVNSQQL